MSLIRPLELEEGAGEGVRVIVWPILKQPQSPLSQAAVLEMYRCQTLYLYTMSQSFTHNMRNKRPIINYGQGGEWLHNGRVCVGGGGGGRQVKFYPYKNRGRGISFS